MKGKVSMHWIDGHLQTLVQWGAVEFIFLDGRGLITVACDRLAFGITVDDTGFEITLPGGYPLPEVQFVPD